jgi:hypothetical protein
MNPEELVGSPVNVQPLSPEESARLAAIPTSPQAIDANFGSEPSAWTDFTGRENIILSSAFLEEFPEFRPITTVSGTNTTSTGVTKIEQKPLPNPLHEYESYTYGLSLHLLGSDSYNALVGSLTPDKVYIPQNVLVVSAGRYNQFFNRDPSFKEDFYFENFRMKTYITTTARNRNSNLIECSFTIIEPNGFTFINRLIEAANRIEKKAHSYLQMPFLLQVDFFGSKNGDFNNFNTTQTSLIGPIPGMSKYIPIRLVEIGTKVTSKGTEYNITAAPYNHQAYSQLHASLPIATTVTGALVKDMFSGASISPDSMAVDEILSQRDYLEKQISALQAALQTTFEERESDYYSNQITAYKRQLTSQFNLLGITGYCDAINEYYRKLKQDGLTASVSTVRVEFDSDIGNARLMKNPVNISSVPVSGTSLSAQKASIQGQNNTDSQRKGQLTYDGATINIPAGMSIDKLIDWSVRNSDYIGKQIRDPEKLKDIQNGADPVDTWLNWFKITPSIKIKEFDQTQNRYSYDIVYYVKKFKVANKYPYAPRGKIPGYVKRYDYIFTGKNNDIIDLTIDFNLLAVTELSMARNKDRYVQTGIALNNPAADPDVKLPDNALAGVGVNIREKVTTNVNPVQLAFVNDNPKTANRGRGGVLQDSTAAGDIQRNLNISAKGDMIAVELKIIGDPQFIKQDDIFYYQTAKTYNQQFIGSDQGSSLYMDGNELYVFLNFESPEDYDENLGLALKKEKYRYSEFSGVYKVILIENIFQKGKFEQTLELVKLFYDQDGQPLPSVFDRIDSIAQAKLIPSARLQTTRYSGPSLNLALLRSGATQNVQTALQGAANQVAGIAQQASVISQLGQQVLNQAVGKAVSAVVGKGLSVVTKVGKDFIADLTAVKVDPNIFDLEDAALGQLFSENLAASLPSDLPDFWSDASLDLGDINLNISDISDFQLLDLGDINNFNFDF